MTEPIRRRALLLAAGGAAAMLAGCTRPGQASTPTTSHRTSPPAAPVVLAPASAPPVLVTGDLATASLEASRALYVSSPVAVVVDPAAAPAPPVSGAAQKAAANLGVPLLVTGPHLVSELDRLRAKAVVTYGAPHGGWAGVTGGRQQVTGSDSSDPAADVIDQLPPIAHGTDHAPALVLTGAGSQADHAALATARASGATVVAVTDGDPRSAGPSLTRLRDGTHGRVVGIGSELGPASRFVSRVAMARNADELPGGGVLIFPERRMVALYGHPGAPALGVLGEQGISASVRRAQEMAQRYAPLSRVPVVPAWEIIATVAASAPGPDGNYSNETPVEQLRPWVRAAAAAQMYVVLDLQPGRTDFLSQAKRYEELLKEPHVGLALDPEWRLGPHELPLRRIGSVDISEVNRVAAWLAELVSRHQLPQKLLTLHQFRTDMLSHRSGLDTAHDELAVLVHADGQGSQPEKQATWRAIRRNLPDGVWMGWKNFYDEDHPMLTPKQTMTQVVPAPWFVSYQ